MSETSANLDTDRVPLKRGIWPWYSFFNFFQCENGGVGSSFESDFKSSSASGSDSESEQASCCLYSRMDGPAESAPKTECASREVSTDEIRGRG